MNQSQSKRLHFIASKHVERKAAALGKTTDQLTRDLQDRRVMIPAKPLPSFSNPSQEDQRRYGGQGGDLDRPYAMNENGFAFTGGSGS